MVTVREINDGAAYCCPECKEHLSLGGGYDLAILDELTLSCPMCGNDTAIKDFDTELPGCYIEWAGHSLVKTEETFTCKDCESTAYPILGFDDAPEWKVLVYVLARLREYPCTTSPSYELVW